MMNRIALFNSSRLTVIAAVLIGLVWVAASGSAQTQKETKQWQKLQKQIMQRDNIQEKITLYEKFMQKNPDSFYLKEAKSKLEDLCQERDFQEAEMQNTVDAYTEFVRKYPRSRYLETINTKLLELKLEPEEIDFILAKAINTADSYAAFIGRHPQSIHLSEIKTLLKSLNMKTEDIDVTIARGLNTEDAYTEFLRKYPKSKHVKFVKNQLLSLNLKLEDIDFIIVSALKTVAAYESFLKEYPGSPRAAEITRQIADLKNCKLSVTAPVKDADVYIGSKSSTESGENPELGFDMPVLIIGNEYLKGKTPLSIDLEPGIYKVAVLTSDLKGRSSNIYLVYDRDYSGKTVKMTAVEGCVSESFRDDESIIFVVVDRKIIRGGKIITINLKPDTETQLVINDLFELTEIGDGSFRFRTNYTGFTLSNQ